MLDLIAAAGIGGITVGALVYLAMKERVAAAHRDNECWDALTSTVCELEDEIAESEAAHTRCSDALETARNRIERALEQITPGSNATVKRIARILRGEQG